MLEDHFVLVEDRPEEAELIELALEQANAGGNYVWLKDGQEALDFLLREDYVKHMSPTPRMIILDLKLPKVDGLDVLRQLRSVKEFNKVPIIILTSSDREEDKEDAYNAGANSYLIKSPDFNLFSKTVKELSAYWLGHNQVPEQYN